MSVYHSGNPLPPAKTLSVSRKKRLLNHALGFTCLFLKLRSRTGTPPAQPGEPIRILILEPFGMGDIIALEPLVANLLANGVHVTLAGQRRWKEILPPSPSFQWLSLSVPWASYSASDKYKLGRLFSTLTGNTLILREAARGAIGIDPRGDLRSVALLWRSGCSRVLTLSDYSHSDAGNPEMAAETWNWDRSWGKWRSNLESMTLLALSPIEIRPPRFDRSVPRARSGARVMGLVPTAPWEGKLWPPHRWRDLVQSLMSEGWTLRGLGGPGQANEVRHHLGDSVLVTECTSLAEWRRELESLDHLVSVDSGPMHLAAALGVPTTALFGGGLLPVWAPSGAHSSVVTHQFDPGNGPCHQIRPNLEYEEGLMRQIRVEEVTAAVRLLGSHR